MANIKGFGGTVQEVEANTRAARAALLPRDVGALGAYRVAAKSGAITGTAVVAGAPLFSLRWTDATRLMVLTYLRAVLNVTTIFTAAQEIGLDAMIARTFTASDSAGTAIALTTNNNKLKTSMGASLVGDMRIATTTLLTAGTRTLDGNAFAMSNPVGERVVNAAGGTAYLPSPPQAALIFEPNLARGDYPLVLAQNEGFLVRNQVVLPAAGVMSLMVELAWLELTAWP